MLKILLKFLVFGVILYFFQEMFEGFIIDGDGEQFILNFSIVLVSLVVIDSLILPIVRLVTIPLNIITLGSFGTILNVGVIYSLSFLLPNFSVVGIGLLVGFAVVLSIARIIFK